MSSLIPAASASGTGSMTLAAPVTNSNQVITLPDATGTAMVSGAMPNFRVYATSGTSCANNTFTKILFQGVTFDTNSNYTSSTFTPTVAGYYQINATVSFLSTSTTGFFRVSVFKNGGSTYFDGVAEPATNYLATWSPTASVSGLVYCNGTTDYIEIYAYQTTGSTFSNDTGTVTTYCSGFLTRAA